MNGFLLWHCCLERRTQMSVMLYCIFLPRCKAVIESEENDWHMTSGDLQSWRLRVACSGVPSPLCTFPSTYVAVSIHCSRTTMREWKFSTQAKGAFHLQETIFNRTKSTLKTFLSFELCMYLKSEDATVLRVVCCKSPFCHSAEVGFHQICRTV